VNRRPLPLWQRNVVAGVTVGAALWVATVTDLGPAWSTYRAAVRPAHVVPAGGSVIVADQTWSIAGIRHLGRAAGPGTRPLPAGAVMIAVTVDRSGPVRPDQWCMAVLTDGNRHWRGESPSMYGIRAADGAAAGCASTGGLQWIFVVPGDAVPTALDITGPASAILVRLQM
jgi:hypothetical protein